MDVEPRRKVVAYTGISGEERIVSTSCMHCEEPACLAVCPAEAIQKRADGIVVVDKTHCIGCRYCSQACPFEVPHFLPEGMDKCDCCLGNGIAAGDIPYCVQECRTGALRFGTMQELRKRSEGKAQRLEAPTNPSVYVS